MKTPVIFLWLATAFTPLMGVAQEQPAKAKLLQLLDSNRVAEADRLLKERLDRFTRQRNTDSLAAYVMLTGNIATKRESADAGKREALVLVKKIGTLGASDATMSEAFANLGEFYGGLGDNKHAYEAYVKALEFAEKPDALSKINRAKLEQTLAEFARRMANVTLARKHYLRSVALEKEQPKSDQTQLYKTYMSLAVMCWYSSKLDSAEYFFKAAIEAVEKIDDSPLNKYYRHALISNNLAGVYSLQGKTDDAIHTMEDCIARIRKFLKADGYHEEKKSALSLQFEAIDNLGGAYKELGNYSKTEQLLQYSFEQKQIQLQKDDPGIFISQILLGQLYYATSDYKKALQYLTDGRAAISKSGTDYLFWNADACYTLAMVYERQKAVARAGDYYRKADSLYALAFSDSYDNIYLEFLNRYTDFQAQNGQCATAKASALRTLDYVLAAGNEHSLLPFYQLRNIAELSYKCRDFQQAQRYAKRALELIDTFVAQSNTLADSIKTAGEKAKAVLIRVMAAYELDADKHPATLKALLRELEQAADIIERKKRILTDQKDFVALIADYKELTDFIKRLNFELYERTQDYEYLGYGLNVHEAGLYSRIRSRMDYQKTLQFANLPTSVLDEENRLKVNVHSALQKNRASEVNIVSYRKATGDWNAFLQKLERQYPAYYAMRYAEPRIALVDLARYIPEGMTVVRYIFSGEQLYAFIVSSKKQLFIPLDVSALAEEVETLRNFDGTARMGQAAYRLYRMLWAPIEREIVGRRVTIIPDGILHHVSFEMLTPAPTHRADDLWENCLLKRYAISYHFSLLALHPVKEIARMKSNFVAFTPVFSERGKQHHLAFARSDSMRLDRTYLSLLPLPFTAQLAKRFKREFGGHLFTETASTSEAFRSQAGGHRIIYIGTHAEANDDFPEYSRLIFAKDNHADLENSVYLYDIYNCNLTSHIAVLTACETGKSGYLDGEGMVSMAHAFSYAGSQSILAGLWKIDEQSSAMITELFYENLKAGFTKDEALWQAKLTYLKRTDGRMRSPQYWAGLAIMGDLDSIALAPHLSEHYYYLGGAVLLLLAGSYAIGWRRRIAGKRKEATTGGI